MILAEFRKRCPYLVHYAPQINLTFGLLTAAQILDRNADEHGFVLARFRHETEFQSYPVDYWKTHSRFVRRAGEAGCCLIVQDAQDATRIYVLGNNFPLGDGQCLGTTIPLSDNRPGDAALTREEWFRILNDMFWVFPEDAVNAGFVERLRVVTPGKALFRVRLSTDALPDEELDARVRLCVINGGGSNGAFARGTATYKRISDWSGWPPKELGLCGGLPGDLCDALRQSGDLSVQTV
ncbi:MAG: hypothetical protein ACJ8C4_09925 [Gemmataceae bacterium]